MKKNKHIIYSLFILVLVCAGLTGCSDDNDKINYQDDSAYPPPVVTFSSEEDISAIKYMDVLKVTGTIESKIGLRDLYYILQTKDGEEYVDLSNKIYYKLDKISSNVDFTLEIPIRDKTIKSIAIVATDILTKYSEKKIIIQRLMGIPPQISTQQISYESVAMNQPINLKGTVTSGAGLKTITYTLIQEVPNRVELQAAQNIEVTQGMLDKPLDINFTITKDNTDALEIKATDIDGYAETVRIPIKSIAGVSAGKAYILDNIEMAPEYEYPINPVQPYLFSSTGISVNGELKNVLSLAEANAANSRGLDFAFINVWKNTANASPMAGTSGLLGQRGFAFCDVSQLNRGPIGRQCDLQWLTKEVRDTTCMILVPNNLVQSMNLDNFFETTKGRVETYNELGKLSQLVFTVGTTYYILQKTGASSDNTTATVQNIKKGSYIAFRRENNKDFKYGIIKVTELADDSDALAAGSQKILGDDQSKYYTAPTLAGYTYNGVAKLYGKKCKLKIIVQY